MAVASASMMRAHSTAACAILSVTIVGIGIVYLVLTRAHQNSNAPHNDAIPAH